MAEQDTRVEVVELIGEYVRELLRPDTIAHLRVGGVAESLVELISTIVLGMIEDSQLASDVKEIGDTVDTLEIDVAALTVEDDTE